MNSSLGDPHIGSDTAFATLSPAVRRIWAKSGQPAGHGLLAHMLDVAAVAECVLKTESPMSLAWAASNFGLEPAAAARWLACMVGLHDLGKATPGFQAKWPAGRAADEAAGLVFRDKDLSKDWHDLASAHELGKHLAPWCRSPARAHAVASAVAAHHGYVFEADEIHGYRRPGEPPEWARARNEVFDAYMAALAPAPCRHSDPPSLAALAWLAGLTSASDWIGSNPRWFSLAERDASLRGHHHAGLALGEQALREIGWPAWRALLAFPADAHTLIARIVGDPEATARPLQLAADRLLADCTEPALVLVEAPMGEGKTELAMLAHLRLQAALGHRGLFIGLPTQATGTAMFHRTLAFLRAFGNEAPLDMQLAHGGSMLAMEDERLVELRAVGGGPGNADDSVRSSAWFSQRRRPLLSPYGVGTIDQALLANLNVKHHFVRLWGLANRVVVLDEVHAYDTYTSGLIEALLRWLKALRCSVVLMSATLPRDKRHALLRAWGTDPADAPLPLYPRLLVATHGTVRGEHFPARQQTPIATHSVAEDLGAIADVAFALVRQGGCGAVVVNTVARAQELYGLLLERMTGGVEPMLFHARYPADERQQREHAVLATFGRDAVRPEAALLVATQVVEQSLDIDFDFLITDLAPVDLLLQRAGRLHRHSRPTRPVGHAQPRVWIAGSAAERLPDLAGTGWRLYDEYLLLRTWAFLRHEAVWRLPQDIDRLVQLVYGDDELPQDLGPDVVQLIDTRKHGEHLAETEQERRLALHAALDVGQEFQNAYSGKPRGSDEGSFPGVRNATRLGPDSVIVIPIHTDDGAWRLSPEDEPFDPCVKPEPELARRFTQRQMRLSRRGVVDTLRGTEPPTGFAEHPWLRHVKVLALQAGSCSLGGTKVTLDADLGLVYAPAEQTVESQGGNQ